MDIRYKYLAVLGFFFILGCENKSNRSAQLSADVGPQIRAIRLAYGMTQKALADSIGIGQNALSLIEDGMATPIHLKLIEIETYFDTTFEIGGERIKIKAYLARGLK